MVVEDYQDGGDAAAQAFEEIRAEVTLLRRAIERLTAERAELPAPKDYDETLGRIAQAINKLAGRMDVLADRPGIKITPEGIARQIATAGGTTRADDQRTIAEARGRWSGRRRSSPALWHRRAAATSRTAGWHGPRSTGLSSA